MRTPPHLSTLLPCLALLLGCGGGHDAAPGPQSPAPAADSAAPATTAAPPAADAGPATTTTTTLGTGGDLQGARLSETHTVAATTGSSAPVQAGPHGHEPGRGPADIRAIVIAHRDEARACYDNALSAHPGIEGDLVIEWTIDPKGNVTQVAADTSRSQISEASVIACASAVIKKIQFAPSPGGYETKAFYPFNFHPHHNQGGTHTP